MNKIHYEEFCSGFNKFRLAKCEEHTYNQFIKGYIQTILIM